jgi:hypothetical protein
MEEDRKLKEVGNAARKYGRKPYIKPQLTKYGHMEKLTEGTGSKPTEFGGNKRN